SIRISCLISLCESPIEMLFLANFLKQHINFYSIGTYDLAFDYGVFYDEAVHSDSPHLKNIFPKPLSKSFEPYQPGIYCSAIKIIASSGFLPVDVILGNIKEICIIPQSPITVHNNIYRVDFQLIYTL